MIPAVWIGAAFFLGGAAGLVAARDFLRAAAAPSDAPVRGAVLGMIRRAVIFLVLLVVASKMDRFGWAGAAAGYLIVFMSIAFRQGLAHGR